MIRILLIRHGDTDLLGRVLYGRMPGVHLSSEGIRQIRALAEELNSRYTVSQVVSSPLERALKTAEAIAAPNNLPVTMDEDLTEIDFGTWMGKSFSELHSFPEWHRYNQLRSIAAPPGGESMMQVQARAWRGIARLVESKRDAPEITAAVVTHGDIIRGLLLLLLGLPIDHIHRLEIAPASVSEVLLGRHAPLVRSVNHVLQLKKP